VKKVFTSSSKKIIIISNNKIPLDPIVFSCGKVADDNKE
jgi:hypothetical protein